MNPLCWSLIKLILERLFLARTGILAWNASKIVPDMPSEMLVLSNNELYFKSDK